jgi:N-acetylglucosamine-6-phosphate deacetylase
MVRFPTPEMIEAQLDTKRAFERLYPTQKRQETSAETAVRMKSEFAMTVDIVNGVVKSSQEQMDAAIDRMYSYIFEFRQTGRLEGSFLEGPSTEVKLKDLEDKVERHDGLLNELKQLAKQHWGPQSD